MSLISSKKLKIYNVKLRLVSKCTKKSRFSDRQYVSLKSKSPNLKLFSRKKTVAEIDVFLFSRLKEAPVHLLMFQDLILPKLSRTTKSRNKLL